MAGVEIYDVHMILCRIVVGTEISYGIGEDCGTNSYNRKVRKSLTISYE